MTANPFAALLNGVPRFDAFDGDFKQSEQGSWVTLASVLAALAAAVPADLAEAGKVLEGVTPGPWTHDGEPWDLIVWDGNGNRVCFMAHSNRLDDARDVATARFIAWCRESVPALLARIAAQEAQIKGLEAEQGQAVADWSDIPDVYVTSARKIDGIFWEITACSVPLAIGPEVRLTRADAAETALAPMTKERDELRAENERLAKEYDVAKAFHDLAVGERNRARDLNVTLETALAAERAKVAKLVEALTFYSCKDGCNDCSENERDLIGCGWTARAAITEAGQ